MTEFVELDQGVLEIPFSDVTKSALLQSLLPEQSQAGDSGIQLEHFWTFYYKECAKALQDGGRHVATRTHRDIVDCVQKLKGGMVREGVRDALGWKVGNHHANTDEMLNNSIDLAASLVSMMSFGPYSYGFSGRQQLSWEDGSSLADFLGRYWAAEPTFGPDSVKLEKVFTARNLERIAGLQIVWTDNLVEHLRLTDDDRRVHIFHHASFLECQKRSEKSLLPEGLARETLQTYALLFPSSDNATKQWLAKTSGYRDVDKRIARYGQLKADDRRIGKFRFWRDRLVMLKQVFDEAQPKTMGQWWHDRRNGVQWYTFWVAALVLVLTIVFGLIQSVEGALQVYASFQSIGPRRIV